MPDARSGSTVGDGTEAASSTDDTTLSATAVAAPPLPNATITDAVEMVDTREAYLKSIPVLAAGHGPIAVDAERASGFRYSQRAYLIQVHREGSGTFLYDPPAIGSFAELQAVIGDEEWILHAASQDLACLREVGLDPTTIFDTELAARLLGLPRVGLASVVESLLGLHLKKEHSAADWSTRPLPSSWLDYAALDVQLLPELRQKIGDLLDQSGKTEIAEQEFNAVLARELPLVRTEPWRRLSGVHTVKGVRGLAVARELWTARDDLARQLDVSPGRLVPDGSLVAAARAMPRGKRELAALREFSGRASRTELDRWWAAIEKGQVTEDLPQLRAAGESIPPPRSWADRSPEADRRLKGARAAIVEVAEALDMPVENLLTPDTLRRLAWQPPASSDEQTVAETLRSLGARPWQIEATAQKISDAFVAAHQAPVEDDKTAS